MKTSAPELSALIIILRSTGPVIFHESPGQSLGIERPSSRPPRTFFVSGRNWNSCPRSELALPLGAAWRGAARARVQLAVEPFHQSQRLAREDRFRPGNLRPLTSMPMLSSEGHLL